MDKNDQQFTGGAKGSSVGPGAKPKVRFGRFDIPLPNRPFLRILLGTLLIIGGLLWFLPLLGLWMLPLGLLVLSVDIALIRRFRRKGTAWWARRAQAHK